MTFIAVFGAVVFTLLVIAAALSLGGFAVICFMGFDEVNIPMGILFTVVCLLIVVAWWLIIGVHINVGWS